MTSRKLLTAPQVARLCGADLKTIHNWVNAGEIRHFRTPGRHLRFRVEHVVAFLRDFGYPVPVELVGNARPAVAVLDPDRGSRTRTRRALARSFEVRAFACPVEALLAIGRHRPDAAVVEARLPLLDGHHVATRLAASGTPTLLHGKGSGRAVGAAAAPARLAALEAGPAGGSGLRQRVEELLATRARGGDSIS